MRTVLVSECAGNWFGSFSQVEAISPSEYLSTSDGTEWRSARVYNLCSSYSYQSLGYYVSLLAEARGQKPFPDVITIQDLSGTSAVRLVPHTLEDLIQRSLEPIAADEFCLSVYFGENLAKRHARLAKELYALFQAPLLQFKFSRRARWRLRRASAIGLDAVPANHREFVAAAAGRHFARRSRSRPVRRPAKYDMAILHNPAEGKLAPSDETALKKMIKAAAAEGVAAELITRQDAGRVFEFDALFIRETTAVSHHTYRLARRAEAAGMIVIDDPLSIVRCTNKVYLAELLGRARIPSPATMVVHRNNAKDVAERLAFPCVLKRPDSAFSQGVVRANDAEQLASRLSEFFRDSELVIAQRYMPTDFDWRIGILDQQPLFACKYYMARGHWQIAKQGKRASLDFGKSETVPIEDAPQEAVAIALKAANLIGNGLYGVDVKEHHGEFYVVEVNDNPNLDSGVEDAVLRDGLYRQIIQSFVRRIESLKNAWH